MAEYKLGKICPIFKGDWVNGTTYDRLDVVLHDYVSYVSLVTDNDSEPTETNTNWLVVAKGSGGATVADVIAALRSSQLQLGRLDVANDIQATTINATNTLTLNGVGVLTEDAQRVTDVTIDQTYDNMVVLSWDGEGSVGGRDETILAATSTLAGVMSAADKVKLDKAITGVADFNLDDDEIEIEWSNGDILNLGAATSTLAGLMTAADKAKLDSHSTVEMVATLDDNTTVTYKIVIES